MSRIGKKPIEIPANVKLSLDHRDVHVEGPRGRLEFKMSIRVKAVLKDNRITFDRISNQRSDGALQGTTRSVVANMIHGVTDGFLKELAIEGVGFKAAVQGKQLSLLLGFTHPVIFDVPEGLVVETPKPTQVIVKGIDKVKVGYFAAKIRKVYEAEPYKGKGVRYLGEVVRRKAGKTVTK
ncbi:MAG: 50S ribosomal protein L6 [Candidatus Omnitrophica bacterium CG07_land_8_20_14_0_80_50_8]|nr:MAG: 50S ribosomal protein L6 [Candidatus Omnitrophica bacterium CG1_02_49_16]PIU40261.1 MAG: 50S ribosomal protein L6 [Candidatus Omnitrophica bacterium CG07_land_8_20_14_0_80_50_8]